MDPVSQSFDQQPPAQSDPARQKTEAEIKKLQREAEKLEKEVAAIPPADLVRRKAELERDKAAVELEKLSSERRRDWWVEPIKAIAGLSSILLALVAVGTLWVSVETARLAVVKTEREAQRAERDLVSALIRDLGAEQRSVRATSARRLAAYINDQSFTDGVTASLTSTIALEEEAEVQDAILLALEPLRPLAQLQLDRTRLRLDGENARLLSSPPDPSTHLPAEEKKIQNRQQSVIKIVLTLASGVPSATNASVPKFDNFIGLRRAKFFNFNGRLKGATFQQAALTEADFYELDLTGARFDGAWLEAASFISAKLVGARFDGAKMHRIEHHARGPLFRTRFHNADLTGASFVDACLAGADFTRSNVDVAALAKGYTQGIQIEPDKLAQLGTLRSHPTCQTIQE